MASRWFVSKIVTINAGTEDEVTDLAIDLVKKPDGTFFWPWGTRKWYAYKDQSQGWALVLVNVDLAEMPTVPVPKDPNIFAMPDFGMDVKLSAMNSATRTKMLDYLTALGIDATALATASDGYRDMIRGIGRKGVPTFDENSFGQF